MIIIFIHYYEQKSDNINKRTNIDINYELNDSFDLYYGCNITTSFENISSLSKERNTVNVFLILTL